MTTNTTTAQKDKNIIISKKSGTTMNVARLLEINPKADAVEENGVTALFYR